MRTCGECHDFRANHPDLPPDKQNGCWGLCVSCWKSHTVQNEANHSCPYWTGREPERLLKECPQCQEKVWKWLHHCPSCGHDFRKKCEWCEKPIGGEGACQCEIPRINRAPKSMNANKPDGGNQPGWLRNRRAANGW